MLHRVLDLFRAPDPTSDWPPPRARSLTLDLETGAINDIRPHAPWTDLEDWGRPANPRPLSDKRFAYPEMGITLLVAGERLIGADLHFQARDVFRAVSTAALCEGFVPARLRMVAAGGSEMRVTPGTTPDELRARLARDGPTRTRGCVCFISGAGGIWTSNSMRTGGCPPSTSRIMRTGRREAGRDFAVEPRATRTTFHEREDESSR